MFVLAGSIITLQIGSLHWHDVLVMYVLSRESYSYNNFYAAGALFLILGIIIKTGAAPMQF
jgi:NADH:ubiquinone oxidoreductase subunit 2 (subunit N)